MNLTIIFITLTVLAWLFFDIYIIAKKGKHESISAHIIRGSKQFPMLAFLVGFLCGHLFWKMSDEDVYKDLKCESVEVIK